MGLYDQAVSFASDLARQQQSAMQSSPSTLGLGPDFSSLMQYLVGQAQRRPIGRAVVNPIVGGAALSNLATETGESFIPDIEAAKNFLVDQGVANTVNTGRSAARLFKADDTQAAPDAGTPALSPTGGNFDTPGNPPSHATWMAQQAASGDNLQYTPAMLNTMIGRPSEITPPNYAPPSQADFGPPASLADPNAVHQGALNSALAQSALPQDFRQAIAGSNVNPQDVQDVYANRGAGGFLQAQDTDANIAQLRSNLDTAKARLAANPRDIAAETATIQLQHELDRKTAPGGQDRFKFLNESPQENAARALARPISDDPSVQAHLASLGFTPSGGTMENRGGVQVEVPLSRNFADLSLEQAYGIQAGGGLPYSDPRLQGERIQQEGLLDRNMQESISRVQAARILANQREKSAAAKSAAENNILVDQPNGTKLVVDKNALQPGQIIGDPRTAKVAQEKMGKLHKFSKNDEGLYSKEDVIPFLQTLGISNGGDAQDSANYLSQGGDAPDIGGEMGGDENALSGIFLAARSKPNVLAALNAYKPRNNTEISRKAQLLALIQAASGQPSTSKRTTNQDIFRAVAQQ